MVIAESLPTIATLGAAGAIAIKTPELLKELYGDLAKPGVAQVGKALETVLGLGNNVLLPLRLLNETCRRFEEKKFQDIADRFKNIRYENIVDVRPEIGTPILEKLSYTDDDTLRKMFIELLAKSADRTQVENAHPAFVGIIENITPDEAILLNHLKNRDSIPYMWVWEKIDDDGVFRIVSDYIIKCPTEIIYRKNIPMYISNLSGMGLLRAEDGKFNPKDSVYDPIFDLIKKQIPDVLKGDMIHFESNYPANSMIASRGVIQVLPFGTAFQRACLPTTLLDLTTT